MRGAVVVCLLLSLLVDVVLGRARRPLPEAFLRRHATTHARFPAPYTEVGITFNNLNTNSGTRTVTQSWSPPAQTSPAYTAYVVTVTRVAPQPQETIVDHVSIGASETSYSFQLRACLLCPKPLMLAVSSQS